MNNEKRQVKEESLFEQPKIVDATGKELSASEIIEFMKNRKEELKKQQEYIEKNRNDEMFANIPRKR